MTNIQNKITHPLNAETLNLRFTMTLIWWNFDRSPLGVIDPTFGWMHSVSEFGLRRELQMMKYYCDTQLILRDHD